MTQTNETYQGWTNYQTWRINLELFDGYETETEVDADYCEELAEEYIFSLATDDTTLMEDYARAFISDVNWYEIAEHINETVNEES